MDKGVGEDQKFRLGAFKTEIRAEKPMALTFCVSNKPQATECRHKGANAIQHVAKPRQAVLLDVKKFRKKYFIVEASEPGRAIIELFNDDPGHRRVYTSETSISFDASDTPDTPEN